MGEIVSGSFKKNKDGTYSDDNLIKDVEERRAIWRDNNQRMKCVMTVGDVWRTRESSVPIEFLLGHYAKYEDEDTVIEVLEKRQLLEKAERLDSTIKDKIKKLKEGKKSGKT